MLIIGQNLALRRLPATKWAAIEQELRVILDRLDGVDIASVQPGVLELRVIGANKREAARSLAALRQRLPDWRFSEGGHYELPEPVSFQVLN